MRVKRRLFRFFHPVFTSFSILLVFTAVVPAVQAQLTARGLGMGTAYTALARGVHAPTWNPANLGLPDNPKFSMSFINLGAAVNNNSFTLGDYNKYVGQYWDDQDEAYILNQIPDSGLRLNARSSARALSFSAGQFAFILGAEFGTYFQVDKSLFELLLTGNELNKMYSLDQTSSEMVATGIVSLSWGQPIEVEFADFFSVGGTLRLYQGFVYANIEQAQIGILTTASDFSLNADYRLNYAVSDSESVIKGDLSFGLDIGAAAQIHKDLTISLGLANLFASMPWPDPDSSQVGYFHGDETTIEGFGDDIADSSWTEYQSELTSRIPVVLRLGAAYREGDFLITGDYVQGFSKGPWTSTSPRFSVGTEWWGVKWLPLRTGISMGGRIGFGTSFGFGIRAGGFKLDLGMMNRGFFWPSSSKGMLVALDIGLELQPPEE